MEVGDICLLKDLNVFRGECRLCDVREAEKDINKNVSNVEVLINPGRVRQVLAILQGDERDLQPQRQAQGIQRDGVQLDQDVGQAMVDRT